MISDPSKKFAIKSIPREFFEKKGEVSEEEKEDELKMQELLQTEITVVLAMDHPNIVKFYQCVYDNTYINIVMELVNGIPLSDYVVQKGKLAERECQMLMFYIMCAIRYFQQKGVVHRDLKLDNIMVEGTESGNVQDLRVKVIDFGISKIT